MKRGGSMELDAALWDGLPSEMVERVLAFLPVPDLCRYRSVCKTWDRLIRSPEFGACAAKRDASFIAMRCLLGPPENTHKAWCFLDLDARRWYTVKDNRPRLGLPTPHDSVAAMDGGLVCRYGKPSQTTLDPFQPLVSSNDREAQCFSIIVYNPIAKAVKELPRMPAHVKSHSSAAVHLVVDNISQQFKVFLITQHVSSSLVWDLKIHNDPIMHIYDSVTNEWQGSTNPFCVYASGVEAISSTVVLQPFLYALFRFYRKYYQFEIMDEDIYRYNIGEDVWEKVNVNIAGMFYSTQLFVSANRFFRVGWVHDGTGGVEHWRLEVGEIKLPGMVQEILFQMSATDAVKLFGVKLFDVICGSRDSEIVASGFGATSILLICKSSQKMMVLDLETHLWDRLPANPMWTRHREKFSASEDYFANPISLMNLILPSSSFWCQEGDVDRDQISATRLAPAILR